MRVKTGNQKRTQEVRGLVNPGELGERGVRSGQRKKSLGLASELTLTFR